MIYSAKTTLSLKKMSIAEMLLKFLVISEKKKRGVILILPSRIGFSFLLTFITLSAPTVFERKYSSVITMIPFAVLYETFSFLDTLVRAVGLDEGMRILEGKTEFLSARIQDIEGALLSASTQQVKKRKREDDLLIWVSKGHALEQKARKLLGDGGQVLSEKKRKCGEGRISFQRCAKLVDVHKLNETLSAHEKEADILLGCGLFDARGPDRGKLIPVGDLLGQVASDGLQQLQTLLLDDNVGRIAIQGMEGIGKTFLMKHLHNSALKWVEGFYYNFWITCPRQFSIRHVQDAVAAAVKCDLPCDGDLNLRAKKLSDTLTGLGSFVIYLDGIPDVQLSLVQIGIPVPAKGSKSKLVITTRSTCVSKILDCCRTVKIDSLSDIEASQLFRNEARISMTSTSSSLAKMCHGVPRRIVDIATHMCGIDDPCEWRNARFELRNLEKGDKLPY